MIPLLAAILIAMLAIMGCGWFVQRAANNGGWTDVFWTYGTGATCALAASGVICARAASAPAIIPIDRFIRTLPMTLRARRARPRAARKGRR